MDRAFLANQLVREILARILAGEYAVDSRLPSERALSDQFHISRGTVRQALGNLVELGVVQVRHGSGVYVQDLVQCGPLTDYFPPEMGRVDLKDILCARKAIETVAVELACGRMSAAKLRELAELVDRMDAEVENLPTFLKHDLAFHKAIVRASDNGPLITAFEAIHEYHRYFQVFTSRRVDDEQKSLAHHRQILSALRHRNAKAAVKAVREHLDAMGQGKARKKRTG